MTTSSYDQIATGTITERVPGNKEVPAMLLIRFRKIYVNDYLGQL